MPRNVVTLVPRRSVFSRRHKEKARARIAAELEQRFRPRYGDDGMIAIDFSKRYPARQAKDDVARELDCIDPGWSRLFRLYPADRNLSAREPPPGS